ncbi:NTP transferase domain-containing protein [Mycolicibacterium insubricum]|nr:NTP transferase domain-containing protein [Mycolicibacterium insubricum]
MRFDAIVLAGGRARRLDGADKPNLLVGGRRLIDVALDAVAGAAHIVVVGPSRDLPEAVIQTREDPPFAGPAAAVAFRCWPSSTRPPSPLTRCRCWSRHRPVVAVAGCVW